jgi:hypothetical protein
VDDALKKLKLTDSERRRLYQHLTCPNCEAYLRSHDYVAGYSEDDLRASRRRRTFSDRYAKRLKNFHEFILNYPLLGGLHPFGAQLARAVKRAKLTTLDPDIWYRAIPDDEDSPIYREKFLPADPKKIPLGAGRFNSARQLGYYVANAPETTAVEVLKWADRVAWLHEGNPGLTAAKIAEHLPVTPEDAQQFLKNRVELKDIVWISKVRLARPLKVLDVRVFAPVHVYPILLEGLLYTGSLGQPTDSFDKSYPEYRLPQFIADLARRRRLDGIVYSSTRDFPESFGTNLVILNAGSGLVNIVSDPVRYRWSGNRPSIMDLSLAHLEEWPLKPEGE